MEFVSLRHLLEKYSSIFNTGVIIIIAAVPRHVTLFFMSITQRY